MQGPGTNTVSVATYSGHGTNLNITVAPTVAAPINDTTLQLSLYTNEYSILPRSQVTKYFNI